MKGRIDVEPMPHLIKVGDDFYNLADMRVLRVDYCGDTPVCQILWRYGTSKTFTGQNALEVIAQVENRLPGEPATTDWEGALA